MQIIQSLVPISIDNINNKSQNRFESSRESNSYQYQL